MSIYEKDDPSCMTKLKEEIIREYVKKDDKDDSHKKKIVDFLGTKSEADLDKSKYVFCSSHLKQKVTGPMNPGRPKEGENK